MPNNVTMVLDRFCGKPVEKDTEIARMLPKRFQNSVSPRFSARHRRPTSALTAALRKNSWSYFFFFFFWRIMAVLLVAATVFVG